MMSSDDSNIYNEIYTKIISGEIRSRDELHRAKVELCKIHKLKKVPGNSEILEAAPEHIHELVLPLLKLKPMRTRSGVAPVAVMTSPEKCPHGKCSYCPGGVTHGTAQSYTGYEPAALRAEVHSFGPYHQASDRLRQLEAIGHPTDKIDLIIMGGTFTARSDEYQFWFIKRCFDALNEHNSQNLVEAQKLNETAVHRCIGMTLETRPDQCTLPSVGRILDQGGTRVEMGVQTLDDDILLKVNRGHGSEETRAATRLLKDAGLKVCYHLMPNLPGMTPASDLEIFQEIFENSEYRPDMIKIYPTLVVKGTELYEQWKKSDYEPYSLDETIELIARIKSIIPRWVRIQRIQRDIPSKLIEAGVKHSNLRQLVKDRLTELGLKCQCIRCREIGLNIEDDQLPDINSIDLVIEEYDSAGGHEAFISMKDTARDLIVGFIRLRAPGENILESLNQPSLPKKTEDFAFIRELKVFGQLVSLSKNGNKDKLEMQHLGYGKKLMEAAETHARQIWGINNILVNSGVGARQYYLKLNYKHHGHYMANFDLKSL